MPFRFNQLLEEAGISPADVRLLRHQPLVAGKRLVEVWRTDPAAFAAYQSAQAAAQRSSFTRPYWASFIGTWLGETLFAGIYAIGEPTRPPEGFVSAISDEPLDPATYDLYPVELADSLGDYRGRLYVDWGGGSSGKRAWVQKAESQDKAITELRLEAAERPFPGLMELALPLSEMVEAPPLWRAALAAARGVYLLTCPRDGSQYVGSATGEGGFWARWSSYAANGHGGNVAMIDREHSDYTASILEVAGSAANDEQILSAEAIWKRKLMTGRHGLTRN